MELSELYRLYTQYYKVDTDTRTIRKNTIFFALKGGNFNGNKFAQEALNKGASYAVVDEIEFKTHPNIIVVEDVLETLQRLAHYHRNQLNIPIIALTGSNGKTTTKELINIVLSQNFQTTATIGNLNNHIGVPLTLLSMTPETEIGIVEMGANHLKEIELLCQIATPNYGYITNFGKAHLEGFGGIEGVIKGKSELYQYLKESKGIAFVNSDDPLQILHSKELHKIEFGNHAETFQIELITANPFVKIKFKNEEIQSQLIGKYNYHNIAAAIAIGTHFKITPNLIKKAIENYIPTNNRSQLLEKKTTQIILDAYNANPTSMKAALENFHQLKGNTKKIAILGDMFELGKTSLEEHQQIADFVSSLNFDICFLIGEDFAKTTSKNVRLFKTFDDLKTVLTQTDFENTTVLIKGSRGMALERAVDFIN